MDGYWAEFLHPAFWVGVGQIVWINILLSGDNAVVIALAVRTLLPRQRFWGVILGAGVAVLLRIVFTGVVAQLMTLPFLKLIGGLALLWIAIKLIVPSDSHDEEKVQAADNLWRAVRIIAIADIVMSLDNVIAIAAAADTATVKMTAAYASHFRWTLIGFGLATSIPLIIAGSALLMMVFDRFPIFIWAGAALLGWIAGEIMITDPVIAGTKETPGSGWLGQEIAHRFELWAKIAGALFVVAVGYALRRKMQPAAHVKSPLSQ